MTKFYLISASYWSSQFTQAQIYSILLQTGEVSTWYHVKSLWNEYTWPKSRVEEFVQLVFTLVSDKLNSEYFIALLCPVHNQGSPANCTNLFFNTRGASWWGHVLRSCASIRAENSIWPYLDQIQSIFRHGNYLQHRGLQWPKSLGFIPQPQKISLTSLSMVSMCLWRVHAWNTVSKFYADVFDNSSCLLVSSLLDFLSVDRSFCLTCSYTNLSPNKHREAYFNFK